MRSDDDLHRGRRHTGRGGGDERRGGARELVPVRGIVDDNEDDGSGRARGSCERIGDRAVQRDRGGDRTGQHAELRGEPIRIFAIDRALPLHGAIHRGRAGGEAHHHRDDDPAPSTHAANVACCDDVNAVAHMASLIAPECVRRLAALRANRFDARATPPVTGTLDVAQATERVVDRWCDDLCGLLNTMTRGELSALATRLRISATGRSPELRLAVWARGAEIERNGVDIAAGLQPRPILLGGHLVIQAAARGMSPPSETWPRPLPAARAPAPPPEDPDSLDDLLAAADRLVGVRLGPRGRDKGAWGMRAAELLGLVEQGHGEPDWRGDVEVKTVPVAAEPSGHWGVVEDPAIAMVGDHGLAKLQRTLWLARATIDGEVADATIVSWYLLEWDPEVARLARRYLHERPKGPRGTQGRGLYLSKRFFADAGLLAALNGAAP